MDECWECGEPTNDPRDCVSCGEPLCVSCANGGNHRCDYLDRD